MNKKKELAKNTVIIFLGKVCTQLISFFLLPLYTGYLTTKQYGTVDLIQTYVRLLVPLITIELDLGKRDIAYNKVMEIAEEKDFLVIDEV